MLHELCRGLNKSGDLRSLKYVVVGSLVAMPPQSRTLLQKVRMRDVAFSYVHEMLMGA